jgi:two-component sensor histidine kinase
MPLKKKSQAQSRLRFSIRSALYLVVVMALVPASIIILATGFEHGRHLEEQAKSEALRQAEAFGEIQTRITEATKQVLATIASLPAVRARDWGQTGDILKAVHRQNQAYLNFSITDERGIVVASSLLTVGTDLSERPHVKNALASGQFSTGEYVIGIIESTPSFAYSYPLVDDEGTPYGVINALFKLSSYAALFESFNQPEDSFIGLVDNKGTRIYFYPPRDTNPIGQPIKRSVWQSVRNSEGNGILLDSGSDGLMRFFGYKKLWLYEADNPYMYVVFGLPRASVTGISRLITQRNSIIMVMSALLSLALAGWLSTLLFGSRLKRILDMTERIREGDLDARCASQGDRSDLGRIAEALDGMALAIQKRDRELVDDAARLSASLEEKEILLKEVHHRVKNNLQLILSLIRLQDDSKKPSEASRQDLESRINAMSLVHEMLYRTERFSDIDLANYTRSLAELVQSSYGNGEHKELTIDVDEVHCKLDKAIPFGLLLNELISNAYKHGLSGRGGGKLFIELHSVDGLGTLIVRDDGGGLPAGFALSESGGLGLRLADALAGQLGGELAWASEEGAAFTVRFPLDEGSC